MMTRQCGKSLRSYVCGSAMGAILLAMSGCPPATAGEAVAVATLRTLAPAYTAPAQVLPVAPLAIDAQIAGQITDVRMAAGHAVTPGQVLIRIAGAKEAAAAAHLHERLGTALNQQTMARQVLSATEQRFAQQLATRDDLVRAQTVLKTASLAADTARRDIAAQQSLVNIAAPTRAEVASLAVAQGQTVRAGQLLATLWPIDGAELHAAFYGAQARVIEPGMIGQFRPDGSTATVAVSVKRVQQSLSQPGRLDAWLAPTADKPLPLAQSGEVTLQPPVRPLPVIPSVALVLDQGHWWVMVHDAAGNHRREVTPGVSASGWTAIVSGLSAGETVVTLDAYLLYHQNFGQRYQQPD